jgi:hypothetical protein
MASPPIASNYLRRPFGVSRAKPSFISSVELNHAARHRAFGLNVVQGARLAGAHAIIACDLLDNKLAYAKTFGATHTLNAKLGR